MKLDFWGQNGKQYEGPKSAFDFRNDYKVVKGRIAKLNAIMRCIIKYKLKQQIQTRIIWFLLFYWDVYKLLRCPHKQLGLMRKVLSLSKWATGFRKQEIFLVTQQKSLPMRSLGRIEYSVQLWQIEILPITRYFFF